MTEEERQRLEIERNTMNWLWHSLAIVVAGSTLADEIYRRVKLGQSIDTDLDGAEEEVEINR